MNKQAIYTFKGMTKDATKSKASNEFYFEGKNIRIVATDSATSGSITNEKGNELVMSIPIPQLNISNNSIDYSNNSLEFDPVKREILDTYTGKTSGQQIIIGHINSRDNIIVMTTDDNGFDCIWEVIDNNGVYEIKLKYMRNLGFSTNNLIQAIFNYENDRIQKVYWVDGNNQLRFINLEHSKDNKYIENLIDVNSNTINIVGNFKIGQPEISSVVSGGTHTAGMIQYGYNLYRLNSSQTKLSPLSELIPLDKGINNGGGKVNEVVGSTPIVNIKDIDSEYTHIRIYAVKYTSYNQIPTISLIQDQEIPSKRNITVFDDGNVINDISLSEFLFLGSDPIVPKHIEAKDNILFSANITENNFDIDLDCRAYSFPKNSAETKVYNDIKLTEVDDTVSTPSIINTPTIIKDENGFPIPFEGISAPEPTSEQSPTNIRNIVTGSYQTIDKITFGLRATHDAININYDTYKYQSSGSILGGEGKYVKYEIVQKGVASPEANQYFKDSEVYRLGIEFFNGLGQKSFPKWTADYRMPEGNLEGNYNTLKVTFKPEFYIWLNTSSNFETENDKPVGYRVLRADRTLNDRTIISQGFLNGMMSTITSDSKDNPPFKERLRQANDGNKMPSLQRVFAKHNVQMDGMEHLNSLGKDPINIEKNEVITSKGGDGHIANTYQYNSIIQMFSPDVMFSNVPLYEGMKMRIKGANENKKNQFWGQERVVSTKEIITEGKVLNGLTPHDIENGEITSIGSVNNLAATGIFGPAKIDTDGDPGTTMDFFQFNRDFTESFIPSPNKVAYDIYRKPELTEKGQSSTNYNGDPEFTYYNTLQPMITDWVDVATGSSPFKDNRDKSPGLTSSNTWGAQCITMVLGAATVDRDNRKTLDELFQSTGISKTNVMLVGELVKNDTQIYLGSIYGGNSYEDKKRSNYIEIGKYNTIATDIVQIDSPGDTFVQNFRFAKMVKTDTEVYASTTNQITELVEGKIESSIDLRNRSDISTSAWDSRFQPKYDEYHDYNRVYSQQPTLVKNQNTDYTFVKVKSFDTRIMASKIKVPGENIDNWSDMLVNEVQDLNGKNGPITSLISFKDNIFAFQETALAAIGINPRVQVQGSDGIAVELGSGGILHDYKYVSTTSGCINKWGAIASDRAIYYLDVFNNSFCRFAGGGVDKISDKLGMHSWFNTKLEYNKLKLDNAVLGNGVTLGYDLINNDILLSLHQNNNHTIVFNENVNQGSGGFTSFMDYCPSFYIYRTNKLFSLDSTNYNLYQHFVGEYNNFYGTSYPSYVTLLLNPAVNNNCTFNNVQYHSELYFKGVDQFDKTLTHIHAYNEHQDSTKIPLIVGRSSNLRRKFRSWNAHIPRDGRNRMKNPWIYLKLELENTNNYEFILHDVIVDYEVI